MFENLVKSRNCFLEIFLFICNNFAPHPNPLPASGERELKGDFYNIFYFNLKIFKFYIFTFLV